MNLQALALKQFCSYNKTNKVKKERTTCVPLCERQTQGYKVIVVSLARVHLLGSRTLLRSKNSSFATETAHHMGKHACAVGLLG